MITLASLEKPSHRAVQATIVGEGGMGKTTLAATCFQNPVFIRTEDGMEALGSNAPMAFPVSTTSAEVVDQIKALGREDHDFKTLVIDSVTKLNVMIEQEVLESDPKNVPSINQALGGYGAGQSAVAEQHRQIKQLCDQLLRYKNMNIVFIAHADSESVELPDQDQYTRYTLRMNRKSVANYSDDVDIVAFIKLKTYTTSRAGNDSRKRATSDGSRIITCYPTPSHISKNRYGIQEDIPFIPGTNPLANFIPALSQTETPTDTK